MKKIFFAFLLLLLIQTKAFAQSSWDQQELSSDREIIEARNLVNAGRFAEAITLLQKIALRLPDSPDVYFLIGTASVELSAQLEDEDEKALALRVAINSFQTILLNRPELVRVRLDLARAYFLNGDDVLSKEHFDYVLASNPPQGMVYNINSFLAAINSRKKLDPYINFSIAPEARIKRNTTILTEISPGVFLPFTLTPREPSGSGLIVNTGFSYKTPIDLNWDVLSGVNLSHTEYKGRDLDRTNVNFYSGPRYTFSQGTNIGLEASFRRYFDAHYRFTSDNYSLRLYGSRQFSQLFSMSSSITGSMNNDGDGPHKSLSISGQYYLSTTTAATMSWGFSRTEPEKNGTVASLSKSVSVGLNSFLPYGFTVTADLSGNWIEQDSTLLVLDRTQRKKKIQTLSTGLIQRSLNYAGFSPKLNIIYQRSNTNYQLDIYDSLSYQISLVEVQ